MHLAADLWADVAASGHERGSGENLRPLSERKWYSIEIARISAFDPLVPSPRKGGKVSSGPFRTIRLLQGRLLFGGEAGVSTSGGVYPAEHGRAEYETGAEPSEGVAASGAGGETYDRYPAHAVALYHPPAREP